MDLVGVGKSTSTPDSLRGSWKLLLPSEITGILRVSALFDLPNDALFAWLIAV